LKVWRGAAVGFSIRRRARDRQGVREIASVNFERPYFQSAETLAVSRYIRPAPNFGGMSAGDYESKTAVGGINAGNDPTDV
jgi:hypothetical protein